MNLTLARRATKLFPHHPYTSRAGVKHLRREWMRAISSLGDKWILYNRKTEK